MKNHTFLTAHIAIIGLIAISLTSAIRYFSAYAHTQQLTLQNITAQLTNQRVELDAATHQLTLLINENKTVARKLEEEKTGRLASAAETARAQQKINQLQKDLDSSKAPNVAAIISEWRPRVASVKCHWDLPNGASAEDSGSGVLMGNTIAPTIVTNRHVVTYLGVTAHHCAIQFPGETVVNVAYENDIHPSPSGVDWAKITLSKASPYVKSLATGTATRCTTKAAVGDSIIILGYPGIGARDDVTATEGIISGYEGDYYIASAKVERGNSGGAAIATKQNCYLGTPTYVGAGQLETLARILDEKNIPR